MKRIRVMILVLMMSTVYVFSQNQDIKGLVVDEVDIPIIGATVSVVGTTIAVMTNVDGRFSISVPANVKSLRFTFIGYAVQDVLITPEMRVKMEDTSTELSQVVVTGMTSVDKRLFTGAADHLAASNIKLDGVPDISRALEGRSAGVSVQNVSGTFGTAPRIRVRGATSIYGTSKPLWVVDGVIMDDVIEVGADDLSSGDAVTLISSAIAGLNADDIESFDILKDGSATSIYGARAMAGVIVVTTKKGRKGHSSISYTGEFTTRLKPSYNEFNIMNSQQQMDVYKEMEAKGWLNFAETARRRDSGIYGKMYELLNTVDPTTGQFVITNSQEYRNLYLRDAEMRNTNWFGELFDTNLMHNHSVSISSGTDKTSVYASLSALYDPGWYKKSKVSRYTANLNITHQILNNLSINLISNASSREQKAPGTLASNVDAVSGVVRRDFDINPYSFALNTSRALDQNEFYTRNFTPFNILHELQNNYMDIDVLDVKFQAEIKWKIIPQLELSTLAAIKYNHSAQHHYIKDDSNQAGAYRAMGDATIIDNNSFLYSNPDDRYALPITILPEGGIYQRRDNKLVGYDSRTSITWKQIFDNTHSISAFGGTELRAADRNATWFNGWGLQYDMGEIPFYVYEFFKKSVEGGTDYYSVSNRRSRDIAFFGQATYGFENRYSFQGTLRYEGSNKMGEARSARWLPTWNIGGAWNVTEESFMKDYTKVLSHLKLRGSYSLTGDRGPEWVTNSQAVIASYVPFRPFTSLKESGIRVRDLENKTLTYEKKHELSLALEAGFVNNRFNLMLEWFKKNNYDLIGRVYTQGVGGFPSKYANVAEMKGSGYEITAGSRNLAIKDFSWNTDFVFGHNTTEVTKLDTRTRVFDLISASGFTKVGYPQRGIFSIPFVGLTEHGIPQIINQNGDITSTDINFQESINTDFLKYEGPTDPTYTGSLQNTFKYRNLRLNIFLTYAFGNVVRLNPVFSAAYSDLDALPREYKNRWIMPGDEDHTNIPVVLSNRQYTRNTNYSRGYNAYNYSTERIAKGDFIRMKEISVSYDFPKKWLANEVNNVSLKLQATNLFLLYADKKLNGQDPEFYRSGGVSAPVPKQFTLTLRVAL